jgi:hypothetical protein
MSYEKISSYGLFQNKSQTVCVKHSLCSINSDGTPILFCNKSENKGKEACKDLKLPTDFKGCFSDTNCSSKDSVYKTSTISPIRPSPTRCMLL